jgi:hypothetical protein
VWRVAYAQTTMAQRPSGATPVAPRLRGFGVATPTVAVRPAGPAAAATTGSTAAAEARTDWDSGWRHDRFYGHVDGGGPANTRLQSGVVSVEPLRAVGVWHGWPPPPQQQPGGSFSPAWSDIRRYNEATAALVRRPGLVAGKPPPAPPRPPNPRDSREQQHRRPLHHQQRPPHPATREHPPAEALKTLVEVTFSHPGSIGMWFAERLWPDGERWLVVEAIAEGSQAAVVPQLHVGMVVHSVGDQLVDCEHVMTAQAAVEIMRARPLKLRFWAASEAAAAGHAEAAHLQRFPAAVARPRPRPGPRPGPRRNSFDSALAGPPSRPRRRAAPSNQSATHIHPHLNDISLVAEPFELESAVVPAVEVSGHGGQEEVRREQAQGSQPSRGLPEMSTVEPRRLDVRPRPFFDGFHCGMLVRIGARIPTCRRRRWCTQSSCLRGFSVSLSLSLSLCVCVCVCVCACVCVCVRVRHKCDRFVSVQR